MLILDPNETLTELEKSPTRLDQEEAKIDSTLIYPPEQILDLE